MALDEHFYSTFSVRTYVDHERVGNRQITKEISVTLLSFSLRVHDIISAVIYRKLRKLSFMWVQFVRCLVKHCFSRLVNGCKAPSRGIKI